MTEKLNILKRLRRVFIHHPLQITLPQRVTILNGITLIRELQPPLNENVGSEKRFLY